ncbi:WD40 repeat domain-containing protein [Glycomyces xiaoerkulensis]|uniref:WD40 repeat domain-containing protein n=1 Tax=Glycomyces xiaoerkulensis TaxID=2038139 RepID=UPI000C257258|nr:WD40 repeat domain-containing protein [Glycomyces xiaoerkulensis]
MALNSLRRPVAAATGVVLAGALAACGDDPADEATIDPTGETTGESTGSGSGADPAAASMRAIPSFEDADLDSLGEQIGETWSLGMAGASAMTVAELDGTPVVLSGTRDGDVEIYDLDTGEEAAPPLSEHENAVTELHAAEVDGEVVVISVEVGLAHAWDLASGENLGEIDLGGDYDITTVTEYRGQPVFVNAGKEITVTDLATLDPIEHYTYDLGLSVGYGDVIDIGEQSVLVAANVVGGEYGVGAWDLGTGSLFHDYPMYEHEDRSVSEFAVGYLGETVLVVSGDFGGNAVAWDVAANREYGPEVNIDGSTVKAMTVVEIGGTLVGAAGTLDRTMAFWDVASGEILLETDMPGLGFEHIAVSELDGRPVLVTAGSGEVNRFWLG